MRWYLPLIGLALSLQTSLAFAAPAAGLLARLKLPLPKTAAPLFAANGLGQTSLNTQLSASPEDFLTKLKTEYDKITEYAFTLFNIHKIICQKADSKNDTRLKAIALIIYKYVWN